MCSHPGRLRSTRLALVLCGVFTASLLAGCDSGPSAEEFLAKAKTAQDKGDISTAVIELKNALQSNPDLGEARWRLGFLYIETGQGAAAQKELEAAARAGIDDGGGSRF